MLQKLPRAFAPLCFLAVAACATSGTAGRQTIAVGTEFTLSQAGKAKVENSEVEVRFVSITEDSRCPRDVACISAGQAKVRLDIAVGRDQLVMRDVLEKQSVIADKYQIKVVRVLPVPEGNGKISPSDYRVTLLATLPGEAR